MKVWVVTWYYKDGRYPSESPEGNYKDFMEMNTKLFNNKDDARKFFKKMKGKLQEETFANGSEEYNNENDWYGDESDVFDIFIRGVEIQ